MQTDWICVQQCMSAGLWSGDCIQQLCAFKLRLFYATIHPCNLTVLCLRQTKLLHGRMSYALHWLLSTVTYLRSCMMHCTEHHCRWLYHKLYIDHTHSFHYRKVIKFGAISVPLCMHAAQGGSVAKNVRIPYSTCAGMPLRIINCLQWVGKIHPHTK